MSAEPESDGSVNQHFLAHVVATSATHEVQASEDIVAGNGTKLLAKGARVDAAMRDRLLAHKLNKPLEQSIEVVDGVVPERFGPIAEEMLEGHHLLQALCADPRAQAVPASLAHLRLSKPVQSLLTVYGQHQGDRLRHSIGVAMLALGLGRRLLPGDIERHRVLALAGLVHDVGELYIDPQHLAPGTALAPQQWRHIVAHPLIGQRVLRPMEGAGAAVARAVVLHHERLDGFGYPHGVRGEEFTIDGQILGAAEWLMALVESGAGPSVRVNIATRLVPGEFGADVLGVVGAAMAGGDDAHGADAGLDDTVARIVRIGRAMERFILTRPWIDERIAAADDELRKVLTAVDEQLMRIRTAFARSGLGGADAQALVDGAATANAAALQSEIATVVRELEWRLRRLEREASMRGWLLAEPGRQVVSELLERVVHDGATPA